MVCISQIYVSYNLVRHIARLKAYSFLTTAQSLAFWSLKAQRVNRIMESRISTRHYVVNLCDPVFIDFLFQCSQPFLPVLFYRATSVSSMARSIDRHLLAFVHSLEQTAESLCEPKLLAYKRAHLAGLYRRSLLAVIY